MEHRLIKIFGLVQGIGFRPFVVRMAIKHNIMGNVFNKAGIVGINAIGEKDNLDRFINEIKSELPNEGRIDKIVTTFLSVDMQSYNVKNIRNKFEILKSDEEMELTPPLIPADIATCGECKKELFDKNNRRYRHPFISCVKCGPRYSIIKNIPYDRENIVMNKFDMCDTCKGEYNDVKNIGRCFAQTIACNDCGPMLKFMTPEIAESEIAESEIAESEIAESEIAESKIAESEIAKAKIAKVKIAEGEIAEAKIEESENSNNNLFYSQQNEIKKAVSIICAGGIIALKDIGGFHLVCRSDKTEVVERLRKVKGREKKPFAVMFENTEHAEKYCFINKDEKKLLESAASPIVLLKKKIKLPKEVCGESNDIGGLLPCNPLQMLIIHDVREIIRDSPLIMTSANISGSPIITKNEEMCKWLKGLSGKKIGIDGVLMHDRDILMPEDDSIVRVVCGKTQIFRRSRGYVPDPVELPKLTDDAFVNNDFSIFAAGGDLKSSFCLVKGNKAYMSQYFGDLEDKKTSDIYDESYRWMKRILNINPTKAVCDRHPSYLSVEKTFREFENNKICESKICKVQHHFAHGASVIAEHDLRGNILAIVMDGTGYGEDGHVWGGEFILYKIDLENEIGNHILMKRIGHIDEVELIGGNEGAKNSETIKYGYLNAIFNVNKSITKKDELDNIKEIYGIGYEDYKRAEVVGRAIKYHINSVQSTSAGRLFDAVSSLLGLSNYNNYEGESAILLENHAKKMNNVQKSKLVERYEENYEFVSFEDEMIIGHTKDIVRFIVKEMMVKELSDNRKNEIAGEFHFLLATMIVKAAMMSYKKYGIKQVALSGGTFQNRILLENCIDMLKLEGIEVYINEKVPAGDGGLALGQAYIGMLTL